MPTYRAHHVRARLYTRLRASGEISYYADFRDFAEVGGGQEALTAPGCRYATTDPDEALRLAKERFRELRALADDAFPHTRDMRTLGKLVPQYLAARAEEETRPTRQWMLDLARHLEHAIAYFGADLDPAGLTRSQLDAYRAQLGGEDYNRGKGFSDASIHQHLRTLCWLYDWGMTERYLPAGVNVVDAACRNLNGPAEADLR